MLEYTKPTHWVYNSAKHTQMTNWILLPSPVMGRHCGSMPSLLIWHSFWCSMPFLTQPSFKTGTAVHLFVLVKSSGPQYCCVRGDKIYANCHDVSKRGGTNSFRSDWCYRAFISQSVWRLFKPSWWNHIFSTLLHSRDSVVSQCVPFLSLCTAWSMYYLTYARGSDNEWALL